MLFNDNQNEDVKDIEQINYVSDDVPSPHRQNKRQRQIETTSPDRNPMHTLSEPIAQKSENKVAPPSWFIRNQESPLGLLEELFCHDPFLLLVSTILLNRTSRVQVDVAFYYFLQQWSTPTALAQADPKDVSTLLEPLGMNHRRGTGMVRFAQEYLTLLDLKKQQHMLCEKSDSLNRKEEEEEEESNPSVQEIKDIDRVAFHLTRNDILGLFYCGEYAYTAYRLFIQRDLRADHVDHALQLYVDYQRGLQYVTID